MSIEGVYPLLLLLASVLPQAPQTASVFLSQDFQTAQAPTTTATPVPKDQTMLLPQHDPAGFQLRAGLWETTIVFTLGNPSPKTSQKSQTCQSKSDWVQLVVSEANFSSGVDTCTLTGQTLSGKILTTGSSCLLKDGELFLGSTNRQTVSTYKSPKGYDQAASEIDGINGNATSFTSSSRSRFLGRNCRGLKPGQTRQIKSTHGDQGSPTQTTDRPVPGS